MVDVKIGEILLPGDVDTQERRERRSPRQVLAYPEAGRAAGSIQPRPSCRLLLCAIDRRTPT